MVGSLVSRGASGGRWGKGNNTRLNATSSTPSVSYNSYYGMPAVLNRHPRYHVRTRAVGGPTRLHFSPDRDELKPDTPA